MKLTLTLLLLWGSVQGQTLSSYPGFSFNTPSLFAVHISRGDSIILDVRYKYLNFDSIVSFDMCHCDSLTVIKAIIVAWMRSEKEVEKAKAFDKKHPPRKIIIHKSNTSEMNIIPNIDYNKNLHQYTGDTLKQMNSKPQTP